MMTAEERAEHCRRIAPHGGAVTAQKYDSHHFRTIGKAGARVTMERHGVSYFQGLMTRKGWHGRRMDSVIDDLMAGQVYAELAG